MRLPPTTVRPQAAPAQAHVVALGVTASTILGAGVQPQGCGVFGWIKCGAAIAGCIGSCVATGPGCIPTCVASVAPTCVKCL